MSEIFLFHTILYFIYMYVLYAFYQGKEQASTKVALAVTTIQRYSFAMNERIFSHLRLVRYLTMDFIYLKYYYCNETLIYI